ncbi:uncharacterized protein B0H18DRAFT_1125849 [Fomitopsis serialis]|uniref:uncharacterized protein n=1 Tax=Fomitopsis serialis TaxID=139415 RepID=UPI0020081DA5|nr:uncharacterized protein B0H18DRAFT_1125849 [Neoantrodia serialis]KAH9914041.1 hypothetical protein B0H18DRAFT_1125849 [Neoantrodia serialis]
MGVNIRCRRDESLRNVGRISLCGDLRLSPMADSPPPEIDPQVQGDDHLRFTPSTCSGRVCVAAKQQRQRAASSKSRSRWSGTIGGLCPGTKKRRQTSYPVLAAPNALAKTSLAAKISKLHQIVRSCVGTTQDETMWCFLRVEVQVDMGSFRRTGPAPRAPVRRPPLAPVVRFGFDHALMTGW